MMHIFLVHMCKMVTFPDAFLMFSKFWFSRLLRGERGKGEEMSQNNKEIMSISGTVPDRIVVFVTHVYMCKMMISLAVFSIFFNILIFWVLGEGGVKKQKLAV